MLVRAPGRVNLDASMVSAARCAASRGVVQSDRPRTEAPEVPDIAKPGVYVEEVSLPRSITGVATSVTAFVGLTPSGPLDQPVRLTSFTEFERAFGAASAITPVGVSVRLFFLNGGKAAVVVRTTGSPVPPAADATGIYALQVEPFNLLCLPDLGAGGPQTDPAETAAALSTASHLCEHRRAIRIV